VISDFRKGKGLTQRPQRKSRGHRECGDDFKFEISDFRKGKALTQRPQRKSGGHRGGGIFYR
jgi:hypothetical protein